MTRQSTAAPSKPALAKVQRRRFNFVWVVGLLALASVVGVGLYTSQIQQGVTNVKAPGFTLPATDGSRVSLADYRGKNVLLYFSEGAGCQSCLVQMAQMEAMRAKFEAANVVVLPIVMNSKEEILNDMKINGVTTPFLLDDGSVSTAYGTIGKGMHPGLPGHSFVLIDSSGNKRWYGEYPSMWLAPKELLAKVTSALAG